MKRLKRAAQWRRARGSMGVYIVSVVLLALLLSPLWIALIFWWE